MERTAQYRRNRTRVPDPGYGTYLPAGAQTRRRLGQYLDGPYPLDTAVPKYIFSLACPCAEINKDLLEQDRQTCKKGALVSRKDERRCCR